MKVLVTGANGLLGSHVVRQLLQQNFTVKAMVRNGSNLKSLAGLGCEFFEGQITSKQDVENAVESCDYVIHAAARTSQISSRLDRFYKPNIESTQFLLDACLNYRIKRFVQVSTANCFGNGSKEFPGNEQKPFLPWLKNSGYAYSKLLAQQLVLKTSEEEGLDVVLVNPTFLIGENDVKPSSGEIFFHVINKRFVFCPPGGKNFVDVEKAAAGVVNAMLKGKKQECYLLAGENISYKEFFQRVIQITGGNPKFIHLPSVLLKLLGVLGNALEKGFRFPVRFTSVNMKMLCEENYYSAQKAEKEIAFEIVPVQESMERAILWFKSNNYFS